MIRRLRSHLTVRGLEDRTLPAVFTVLNLNDSGSGSLRDTVALANAVLGADTINFDMNLSGTLKLTSGEISINESVTIQGPGAGVLALSGNNASRILTIAPAVGATVTINGLGFTGGKTFGNGGAIVGKGQTLNLNQCVFTGNSATTAGGALGLENCTLTATECTFSGNSATSVGGAIGVYSNPFFGPSKTTITGCNISGNVANSGGAIIANVELHVENSTVAGNLSQTGVGAVSLFANFAAGKLTFRNSTVSGNVAQTSGAGIQLNSFYGTLVVQNCTITNNAATGHGGGIARNFGTGTVQLDSSIVAQNTSSAGTPDFWFNGPTSVAASASIIGVSTGGNFAVTGAGNQLGTAATPLDAKLGALIDYGGTTPTHRLRSGSPALDKGSNPLALATDQRGFARVFGAAADVGAVEINPQSFFVDLPTDENDGNFNKGDVSLREALELANDFPATADTIGFVVGAADSAGQIKLTAGELVITGPVYVEWSQPYPLTINASGASRVFNTQLAAAGTLITFSRLRLTGGKNGFWGGAVAAGDENLLFSRCELTGNQSLAAYGGAVALSGLGSISAYESTFSNNAASTVGGAIGAIGGGSVALTRCTITGNTAVQGGGVYAVAELSMEESTVAANQALSQFGGGLLLAQTTGGAIIRSSTVSGNSGKSGAGIALATGFAGTLLVQNSTITANSATDSGGGIARLGTTAVIDLTSSIVAGNTAASQGPDVSSTGLVNVNFSAVGNAGGFTLTGGNNLPFGTDLKLGPLQLNGGPAPTHALLIGSPALDKGSNPAGVAADQRGPAYKRSIGVAPDIGAYETAKVFLVTNTKDSGAGSLRQAIADANANEDTADLVRFDPALIPPGFVSTIHLDSGELSIQDSLEIQGPGAELLNLNGFASWRNVRIGGSTFDTFDALFSGLTFWNGKSAEGGAIRSINQSVLLRDCVVTGNTSTGNGGGIDFNGFGTLTLERCSITNNTAGDNGGGIHMFASGSIRISDSTISGNTCPDGTGGGLYFFDALGGPAVLRNSTISGNSSEFGGGGLAFVSGRNLVVQNSTVTKNSSQGLGGGVLRLGGKGDLTLQSTIVAQNAGAGNPDVTFSSAVGTVLADNSILGVANAGSITVVGTGNQTGTLAVPLDAKLSSLSQFGGKTSTHMPLLGSPAFDKGANSAGCAFDQRGQPRAFLGTDVGATETNPANFVVSTEFDGIDSDFGQLSLREALFLANAAPTTADTITFASYLYYGWPRTLVLTQGALVVSAPVAITGPAADMLTISGFSADRILDVSTAAAGTAISISALTLTGGKAQFGGAIRATHQALTLTDCVLTGNTATTGSGGAVTLTGDGSLTAVNCQFTGNSAGFFSGAIDQAGKLGQLVLRSCLVSGNSAAVAGGVFSNGYLLADGSTIANNKSNGDGGGIWIDGLSASLVRILNSTVSGNSAGGDGGGIYLDNFNGTCVIQNSTVTANTAAFQGGGIYRDATTGKVQLDNSIVAQNGSVLGGPDLQLAGGSVGTVTAANAIIGVANSGNFSVVGSGNQTGSAATPLDAKLGVLVNNGGRLPTHRPLAGSPALNTGANPLALAVDQRGALRSVGLATDVGAVELQTALALIVDLATDESDGNFGKGDLSLREAIGVAAASLETAETITFDPTVFGTAKTITLTLGEVSVDGPVVVNGPGANLVTLSGNSVGRILNTASAPAGTVIRLAGMGFAAGRSTINGGAIFANDEHMQLVNCVLAGNEAAFGGGAVYVHAGTFEADGCSFVGNAGNVSGGAVLARWGAGSMTIRRSTVTGNSANFGGGLASGVTFLLESSTVSGNSGGDYPVGYGGGIYLFNWQAPVSGQIVNSTISGNAAFSGGGGIALGGYFGPLTVRNSTITGNTATDNGGGISARTSTTTAINLESSIVANNTAAVRPDISYGTVSAKFSLIGTSAGISTFSPDAATTALLGKNPLLGPLADNGGPTFTHALLPGSPAINAGSNPVSLTTDQRGAGFPRSVAGAVDIGSFENQTLPAKVTAVTINGGAAQRSRVTSVAVTFDRPPTFAGSPAGGFQLKRQSDNAAVIINAVPAGNVVTLTFTGGPLDFGSLADGRYTLTALAAQVSNLDGNGDSIYGDDYTLVGTPVNDLFRLFGDHDGDGDVDATDFGQFRLAFGTVANLAFDFDGDGDVDATDFGQFRQRFGSSV